MALQTIRYTSSHHGDSLHSALIEIREALNAAPEVLLLDIATLVASPPGFVLAIHDVLSRRSPQTQLVTSANTSLTSPDCLLWLAGDHRLMVPSGYLFIERLPVSEDDGDNFGPNSRSGMAVEILSNRPEIPMATSVERFLQDLREATRRMNEYLPVSELAGREIPYRELRELYLIGGELDTFLQTLDGSEPPNETPHR